jgi:hypothetical protein
VTQRGQRYAVAGITVLAVIAILAFGVGRSRNVRLLTPLAGLAFAFVLAGLLFGEDRVPGYGLLAVGVILAVVDIARKLRSGSSTGA